MDDVEIAVLEWVDWFNHRQFHEPIGMIPPVANDLQASDRPTGPLTVAPESLR
jgi:hypothetical protein